MALNFRHFDERVTFDDIIKSNSGSSDLNTALTSENNGIYDSISFIKDSKEIYTHGALYGSVEGIVTEEDLSNYLPKTGGVCTGDITAPTFNGNVNGETATVSGNMYASDFCITSDSRLKDFTDDVEVDFDAIKSIPKKYYYWKDKSMGEDLQIGTSAQDLMKIYPTCVHYDDVNDKYSVNYPKLVVVALAAIDKLHDEIMKLKNMNND